jgi:sulfur-oxidizing protein SoxZ
MSANPYFAFSAVATESGTVAFRWIDDRGGAQVETAQIAVT